MYGQISYCTEIYIHEINLGDEVYNQGIWNNSCICTDNKPIMYKTWRDKGILLIADLFDENGKVLALDVMAGQYNVNITFLDHSSIMNATPKEWKTLIRNKQHDGYYIYS